MMYFINKDDEICYDENYIINYMKENELFMLTVYESKLVSNAEYFYCSEFMQVGEKGDCGLLCNKYNPTNGKNGICKHNKRMREVTDKKKIFFNGKLIKS